MKALAFGRRQVAIDRRPQDRMREPDGRAGLEDARRRPEHRIPPSRSVPATAGQSRSIADLCAVVERADSAGEGDCRIRQTSEAQEYRVGNAARNDERDFGRGGGRWIHVACHRLAQQFTEQERVAAGQLSAHVDEAIVRHLQTYAWRPSSDTASSVRGAGRSDSTAGSPASAAASGVSAASSGRVATISPSGCPSSRRAMNASARADGRVAPLQIVDHQDERHIGSEIRRQPVKAVLPCVVRSRPARSGNLRGLGGAGPAMSTSAANAAAPASQRSRSAALGLEERALEQLARDPERKPLLELRCTCAQDAQTELRRPDSRHLEQSGLPDPRGTLDHDDGPGSLPHPAYCSADAVDLVLALEQRVRQNENRLLHAPNSIVRPVAACVGNVWGPMSGMRPMRTGPLSPTMAVSRSPTRWTA